MSLTPFQIAVAELFFSLPESDGFLLAGGAALAAQELTRRPTRDLDLFTHVGRGTVPAARDALRDAARARGWDVRLLRDGDSFCRLVIAGPEDLLVDLAVDAPPSTPSATSSVGPTFGLEELAGRKLIALFDRAEARDFADVYALAQRFGTHTLLEQAAEIDAGFDPAVLAAMIGTLDRFSDDEIPIDQNSTGPLRAFFRSWQQELGRR